MCSSSTTRPTSCAPPTDHGWRTPGASLRALAGPAWRRRPGTRGSNGGRVHANPFNGTGGNPAGVDQLGNAWTDWNPAQLTPDSPPNPGPDTTALGEFSLGQYINRLYLQAQTSCSIISNANGALFTPPGQHACLRRRSTSPRAWPTRS